MLVGLEAGLALLDRVVVGAALEEVAVGGEVAEVQEAGVDRVDVAFERLHEVALLQAAVDACSSASRLGGSSGSGGGVSRGPMYVQMMPLRSTQG